MEIKKSVVVAYNYRDTANQPVALGGHGQRIPKSLDLVKYTTGKASRSDFINDRVDYIVQPRMKNPPYTRLVHQNADYAVYMFNNQSSHKS